MPPIKNTLCLAPLLLAMQLNAHADVNVSTTLVSDRLLRGFSLSNEEPSLYGGVHYKNKNNGLYGDAVVFTNIQIHGDEELQLDAVAGYKHDFGTMKLDLGYVHHAFSEYDEANSGEVFAGVVLPNFSFHYYDNIEVEEVYLDANAHFMVAKEYNLHLHAGQMDSDDTDAIDFVDYSVGVNRTFEALANFNLGLTYSYNDNDEALKDLAGSRVVLSISKVW